MLTLLKKWDYKSKMESQNPKLNEQLTRAMRLTVELYNAVMEMDDELVHRLDKSETCRDIHDIQNRIYTIAYKNVEFIES